MHTHTHTYPATGPCFILYNGLLRGFGNCGEVPAFEDVEYACERFWKLLSMKTVASRMEGAGHRFSSTMHVLASGIKKLQIIAEGGQGTWLFRGLGKNSFHHVLNEVIRECINSYLMLCRWIGCSAIHDNPRLHRIGFYVDDRQYGCRP